MRDLAIVLDAPSFEPLEPLLDVLEDQPVTAAVGPSLLASVGPSVVQHLRHSGLSSLLDLRHFADPHRMALLAEVAARAGAIGLTVQLAAGESALRAAVQATRGRIPLVGVLTPSWLGDDIDLVTHAQLAKKVGLKGVMGTPEELIAVSATVDFPLRWAREPESAHVSDPIAFLRSARQSGATTVFLGRSVLTDPAPGAVIQAALNAIEQGASHGG